MRTLHLVSHTHWDREWYRTYQQFRIRLVHLVDHLLDILQNDPGYQHFMLDGQTVVLEDYLAVRPEMKEDLLRYIQNGRILVGPWFILPDEYLVSPEATIRNLLEGDRISRKFGPKMMVGYIPDPFGHIGQLPQILRGFNIDTASVMRGLADEPCEFWWEAPDGSRVLMAYLRNGYGNAAGILSSNLDSFVSEVKRQREDLSNHSASPHLLFMHGTDHMEPQAATSQAMAYAEGKLEGDLLVHSTLPNYLAMIKASVSLKELPVVTGELRSPQRYPLLPGVLSTRMWIKQRNQTCENILEKWAEPFSTWTSMVLENRAPGSALKHPSSMIREAWRLLMLCHPHDSICGCSIDQVHDEMRPRFDQVEQVAEEIINQSLSVLAEEVQTSTNQKVISAVVVFNPSLVELTDRVSATLAGLPENSAFQIVDGEGITVPFQTLGLGNSELMNMEMSRKEFRDAFGMVADGVVMGMSISGFKAWREGNDAFIDLVLQEKGEPNLADWEAGKRIVESYVEDASVTTYQIHAQSGTSAQVLFQAAHIPGMGYQTFWVKAIPVEKKAAIAVNPLVKFFLPYAARLANSPAVQRLVGKLLSDTASKPPYRIQNEFYSIEVQPDGTLSILDKRSGICFSGQNRLEDGGDRGDEYNYSPPETDRKVTPSSNKVRVVIGEIEEALEIVYEMKVPCSLAQNRKFRSAALCVLRITSRVSLVRGVPRVDIHSEVENQSTADHRVRVHFPLPFIAAEADYDGHFEVVRRVAGIPAADATWVEQPRPEVPQRAFTHVTNGVVGLVVANRGLPEVEVLKTGAGKSEIAVTLLRCVGWLSRDDFPERKGHAGPYIETPDAQMPGKWSFDYSLISYTGEGKLDAFHQAYAFQNGLRSASTLIHPGRLPAAGSFMEISPAEFVVSTVKATESGRGWLVRGYNISDREIQVNMLLCQPFGEAMLANLAEEEISRLDPGDHRKVTIPVQGHQIVTVLFR